MAIALEHPPLATGRALIEARSLTISFDGVHALQDVSLAVHAGEVVCILGADEAGKSTLVRALAGAIQPDSGGIVIEGIEVRLVSPRDALRHGIATVHQDAAVSPHLPVSRSFFLGREPTVGLGPLRRYDARTAERVCREELLDIGIDLADPSRPIGSLTPEERRAVAVARAMHFGTRVVLLDEPTATVALEAAAAVLRQVVAAKARGLAVLVATRRVDHAFPVGDRFVVLDQGRVTATVGKGDTTRDDLLSLIGRGSALDRLAEELETYAAEVAHRELPENGTAPPVDPSPPPPGVAI